MKLIILLFVFLFLGIRVEAEEKPEELYAQSAVLMDADTGRILFEKDGFTEKAMASTTKIMTCIVALEEMRENALVEFSEYASSQPKVHLGASAGECFYLKDLLYSLMLESHNDVAVAIAETISGSVEAFAYKMNEKAKELGCEDTYFITPNGLDAENEGGMHRTTAADLAKIMSYCIMDSPCRERFLEITKETSHSFSNIEGTRRYSCNNKNNYLTMNQDAISGKTGYTSKAGYCYVGAVENGGRTFVVALLASGWPNHKDYKWKDMRKIISYAMEEYELKEVNTNRELDRVSVEKAVTDELFEEKKIKVDVLGQKKKMLLGKEEVLDIKVQQIKAVEAPVDKGEQLGSVLYTLDGRKMAEYPIISMESVKRIDFFWIFSKMMELYFI